MCDLTKRGVTAAPPHFPNGLAFEIADLVLVRSWTDRHDFRMVVCLDHGAAVGEDYEEVIAFQTKMSPLYRLILWRTAEAVFVQPLVGKAKQYGSVAAALESLLPKQGLVLTDIKAAAWPVHPSQQRSRRSPGTSPNKERNVTG
jgi:hypothetical protein